MPDDCVSATTNIDAPAEVIFAVLANPAKHSAIDGTGWVRDSFDSEPVSAAGQIFWMHMYHPGHPDGDYQIANLVQVFDRSKAISWQPGYDTGDGTLAYGGWVWRYDLTPAGPAALWSRCPTTGRLFRRRAVGSSVPAVPTRL